MNFDTLDERGSTRAASRRTRGGLLAALLAPILAACGTVAEPPPDAAATWSSNATEPMTVAELDGRTVGGSIVVYVPTEGWIHSVRFQVDGSTVATVAKAPFQTSIDTSKLSTGPHVLVAEVRQRNGAVRHRSTVTFMVQVEEPPLPAVPPAAPVTARLTWAAPALSNPITRTVGVTGGLGTLDTTRDYVLVMPAVPRTEALVINGGRNVVLVGGEIAIPHQGSNPSINSRRALYVANSTGVVHLEGLLLHGEDISEGIQINAPGATVQIQNVAIRNVHARDQVRFSDNHPDVIQTWGSVGELRVDSLTGDTDYQGLFFKADYNGPHGPVHLRNVNLRATSTTRYQFWMDATGGGYPTVTLDNVWVESAPGRSFGKTIWPDVDHATHRPTIDGDLATWPTLPVTGGVRSGVPAGGDLVPSSTVGIGYVSPGYAGGD